MRMMAIFVSGLKYLTNDTMYIVIESEKSAIKRVEMGVVRTNGYKGVVGDFASRLWTT